MDYRELLKKYMRLILEEEGVSFLYANDVGRMGITQEEMDKLLLIEGEVEED